MSYIVFPFVRKSLYNSLPESYLKFMIIIKQSDAFSKQPDVFNGLPIAVTCSCWNEIPSAWMS